MFNKLPRNFTCKWNQSSGNGAGWGGGRALVLVGIHAKCLTKRVMDTPNIAVLLKAESQEELKLIFKKGFQPWNKYISAELWTSELDNTVINPSSLFEPVSGTWEHVSHRVISWLLWTIPSVGLRDPQGSHFLPSDPLSSHKRQTMHGTHRSWGRLNSGQGYKG